VEVSQVNTGGNISVIKVRSRDDLVEGKIPVCVTEEALVVPNDSFFFGLNTELLSLWLRQ
jgi:hypothetical protein